MVAARRETPGRADKNRLAPARKAYIMRKITVAVVTLGVTGVSLAGLAGAAGATQQSGGGAAQPAGAHSPAPAGHHILAASHVSGGAAGFAALTAPDAANGTIKIPTTSYTSPTNQSLPVHALSPNTPVQIKCFTEGQTLHNNFYWFRILHNGDLGFVHRDAIAAPRDIPHC
jgi:hypothetical protein